MTATAVDVNDSDKYPTSTLVLLGEQEFVLRASHSRVVFENYNRAGEASADEETLRCLESFLSDVTLCVST